MRTRAVRGVVGVVVVVPFAFAALGTLAAGCTFSTKGAGGDAAAPEYATGTATSPFTADGDAGAK